MPEVVQRTDRRESSSTRSGSRNGSGPKSSPPATRRADRRRRSSSNASPGAVVTTHHYHLAACRTVPARSTFVYAYAERIDAGDLAGVDCSVTGASRRHRAWYWRASTRCAQALRELDRVSTTTARPHPAHHHQRDRGGGQRQRHRRRAGLVHRRATDRCAPAAADHRRPLPRQLHRVSGRWCFDTARCSSISPAT